MQSLETALDPRKSLSGKIISVFLAFVLAFSFSNLFTSRDAYADQDVSNIVPGASYRWAAEGWFHSHGTTQVTNIPPSCTTPGASWGYYCEQCNTYFIPVTAWFGNSPALGHDQEGSVDRKDATCTESGTVGGTYCARCGEGKAAAEAPIVAPGHDLNQGTVTAEPTCTEDGTKTFRCNKCDKEITEAIAATGHSYDDGIVTMAPSCTYAGVKVFTCTECGNVKKEDVATVEGAHYEVIDKAVDATCTKSGLTAGSHCFDCDVTMVEQKVVPAKGHTEVTDKAVDATCTETGLTEGKHCSVCDEILVAQETIDAKDHDWGEWQEVISATCTTAGEDKRECQRNGCNASQDRFPAATGHSEEVIPSVIPTCHTKGSTEGVKCSVCNEILVAAKELKEDPNNHTDWHVVKYLAPTCTLLGHNEYTSCGDCSKTWGFEYYLPLGHAWDQGEVTTPATCTEDGTMTFKCTREGCDKTKTESIPAGHTEVVDEAVDPTCTETGLTEGTHCSACNTVLVAQEVVEAKGHTEAIDEAVDPTCTETGLTEGTHCSVCGEVIEAQEVVPATGHAYGEWTTVGDHQERVCANDARHVETRAIPQAPVVPGETTPTTPTDQTPVDTTPAAPAPAAPAPAADASAAATPAPAAPAALVTIDDNVTPLAAMADGATADDDAADDEAIDDDANPLAAAADATIDDDAVPMGAFDKAQCPYHFVMFFGIVLTLLYGAAVTARRLGFAKDIEMMDKNITGSQRRAQTSSVRGVQGA